MADDFNTPLSEIDKSSTKKINNETAWLNCTPDQLQPTGINRTFDPVATKYTQQHMKFSLREIIK